MTVYTMHKTNEENLKEVIEIMKNVGAPKIKAVFDGEAYWTLEGSHRVAAAEILGLVPEIIEVSLGDEVFNEDIETDDIYPGKTYTAQEIIDEVYISRTTKQYFFEE